MLGYDKDPGQAGEVVLGLLCRVVDVCEWWD